MDLQKDFLWPANQVNTMIQQEAIQLDIFSALASLAKM